MDTPGKYLKRERESRNLSLKEVSRAIRIKESFLWAIEEDRYDLLPPPIYVKGFLTTYARYLGLDPKEIYQVYQDYLKITNLSPSKKPDSEGLPHRRRLFLTLLIIAVISFGMIFWLLKSPKESPKFREEKKPPSQDLHLKSPVSIGDKEELKENLEDKEISNNILTEKKKPSFEVIEASLGSGVKEEAGRNTIIGKASEFICNNKRVYFFTRIKTDQDIKVSHVWYWKDKEFQRIEMDVKPPLWSIYSYLTLRSNLYGPWRVELRWRDEILNSLNFYAHEVR